MCQSKTWEGILWMFVTEWGKLEAQDWKYAVKTQTHISTNTLTEKFTALELTKDLMKYNIAH